mgnify:CR=1 FL=1
MTAALPPVSVVIPLYNKEAEIGRALRSILAQTVKPAAILVVDDGSTDGGPDVVRSFGDPSITLIRQPNAGPSAARNRGIAAAPTDLVALLDADDRWKPAFLETVLALQARHPGAGLWGTGFALVDDADSKEVPFEFPGIPRGPQGGLVKDFFYSSLKAPLVCASGVIVSRAVLDKVGWFPEGVRLGEDFDLWIRIALEYPVAFQEDPLVIYHKDASNRAMNRERYATRDTCIYRVLTKALAEKQFRYTTARSVKRLLGSHLLEVARSAMANGDIPLARSLIREVWSYRVWPTRCLRRWIKTYRK